MHMKITDLIEAGVDRLSLVVLLSVEDRVDRIWPFVKLDAHRYGRVPRS